MEVLRAPIFDVHRTFSDGALAIDAGRIVYCGDYKPFPDAKTIDLRGGFLLPGFVDAHVHFPQLRIIGRLGRSLLDWLDRFALPEEARMADISYATEIARDFVHALVSNGTTTALIFGAHFVPATVALFEAAERTGLRAISGFVFSDRALPPELLQKPEDAYRASKLLIKKFPRYAITPRFAVSASEAMLEVCQTLAREHPGLWFQTHINEQPGEIQDVARRFGWAQDYFGVYERFLQNEARVVLAHNVHPREAELERMAARGVSIAHCPSSNASLGSGIFPMRRHLDAGVRFALGTDVGAGSGASVMREAFAAYLMQRVAADGVRMDAGEMLYRATLAGAEALGLETETGSLEAGKSADIVYLRAPEGSVLAGALKRVEDPTQALEALFTMASAESVREVRMAGEVVFSRKPDSRM